MASEWYKQFRPVQLTNKGPVGRPGKAIGKRAPDHPTQQKRRDGFLAGCIFRPRILWQMTLSYKATWKPSPWINIHIEAGISLGCKRCTSLEFQSTNPTEGQSFPYDPVSEARSNEHLFFSQLQGGSVGSFLLPRCRGESFSFPKAIP